MKLRLLILLAAALAAAPAAGQTIKSLGYNTTNGNIVAATNVTFTNSVGFATNARAATRTNLGGTTVGNAVFTATNAAAAATAIGLGAANDVTFGSVTASSIKDSSGTRALDLENFALTFGTNYVLEWSATEAQFNKPLTFFGTNTASTTRTNLGLGATNNVTFSNVTASGTLTATGNATLNGVNNTMPNATTADSASSLMTRGLLYAAQTDDASGDLVFPGGFILSGTGALAQAHLTAGNVALITTNTNTMAGAYFADSFWTHKDFSGSSVPSDKVLDLALKGVILRMETNQNYVLRVAVGVGTPSRTPPPAGSDALSSRGWGVNFFYNGTNYVYQPFWYTTNYNTGTAVAISNMSTAFSQWTSSVFTLRLRQETNGDIKFWINNGLNSRLGSTPSFQTNVAWGASTFGGRSLAIEAAAATNAAPAAQVRIGYRVGYLKYEQ